MASVALWRWACCTSRCSGAGIVGGWSTWGSFTSTCPWKKPRRSLGRRRKRCCGCCLKTRRGVTAVEHRISREQVIWSFSADPGCALKVDPGEVVTFETNDCFSGQIKTEEDLVTDIDL